VRLLPPALDGQVVGWCYAQRTGGAEDAQPELVERVAQQLTQAGDPSLREQHLLLRPEAGQIEQQGLSGLGAGDVGQLELRPKSAMLIDAEPELRETLRARLERYVIADDVQIEDVTDEFSLFHVFTEELPAIESGRMVSARRFAATGWDIWSDPARHDAMRDKLASSYLFIDSAAADVMRIEQGLPRWGRELTEEIIPIEANLEERTIDYQKGCYIGQEVISRIKMSGQTNKRLRGLISLNSTPLQPGMKLVAPSESAKEVGWVTSGTRSPQLRKEIALGYVKRGFNNPATNLNALSLDAAIPVEVVSLPFL